MMKRLMKLFTGVLTAILVLPFSVRAEKNDKYKTYSEEVRREVWALDLPAFRNTEVPEKYKQYSAVVLAAHSRLEVTKKTRFNVGAFLGGFHYIDREVNCRDLYRMMVLINDKAALKEFSEFDYKTEIKKKEWRYDEQSQQVLGVRVIKPDGSVREVDTNEYMTATEGRKDREQRQKLAVPGLEVGDKIDIFFLNNTTLENHNLTPFVFRFRQNYPMLSYTVHCEVDDKLTTQYRTLNGAPDFLQSRDEEGNLVLDTEVTDVEQTEPTLWYNPIRQSPLTLMYITNSKMKKYTYTPLSTEKVGIQGNPEADIILNDDNHFLGLAKASTHNGGLLPKTYMSLIKKCRHLRKKKDWTDEQKADHIYRLYQLTLINERNSRYNPVTFMVAFGQLTAMAGVKGVFHQTVSNTHEPIDQLISYRNTTWFIELNNGGKRYYPLCAYLVPGEIPADFQGEKASKILNIKQKGFGELKKERYFTLQAGSADDNVNTTVVRVALDGTQLTFDRTEKRTGTLKENWQTRMASIEQVDAALRSQLGIKTRWADEIGRRYADDLLEIFRKGREQEKENYKEEIKYYHGTDAKEILSYRLQSLGHRADSASLVYNVCYTMDGYIRKAGNNMILNAGKLIGEQTRIEGKERQRKADVHMPAARTFRWEITVELPEGYAVAPESLKQLNAREENECGVFIADAVAKDGQLILSITKRYEHKAEPVTNWDKLLRLLDAAQEYETRTAVIKRM